MINSAELLLSGKEYEALDQYQVNIYEAIILHDLHKACLTFYVNPNTPTPEIDYFPHITNDLLTNNAKSLAMATTGILPGVAPNVPIGVVTLNALTSSEGGYCKDAPKEQGVVAKFVYLLDELSVLANRLRRNLLLTAKPKPDSTYWYPMPD